MSSGSLEFAWVQSAALGVGVIWVLVGSLLRCRGHSGINKALISVLGFIRVRIGSLGHLGVVGFIRFRVGFLRRTYRSPGSFVFAWVPCAALRVGQVHLGSRQFTLAHLLESSGSFGYAWVHSGGPRGRRIRSASRGLTCARLWGGLVHSSSRGFSQARLAVVGFIRGFTRARLLFVGFIGFCVGSLGSFVFA